MAQEYMRSVIAGDGRWPYTAGGLLFKDDIEGKFGWTSDGTGSNYVVEHSMDYAFEGDYSMHLKAKTTGPATGDIVWAYRRIGFAPERSLMLSCFHYPLRMGFLYFELLYNGGDHVEVVRLRYDSANNIWQYYNTSGAYVNITGSDQNFFAQAWHSLAISANFTTNKYISLISDGIQMDLSDYSYYQATGVYAESLRIGLAVETAGAFAAEAYFDNVNVSIV